MRPHCRRRAEARCCPYRSDMSHTGSLRRNVAASVAGAAWAAVLSAVIIPLQLHILGVEAYAILGMITSFQLLFSVLDFGLSATVTRAIAADTTPGRTGSAPLVRSVYSSYWVLAIVVAVAFMAGAGWITDRWLDRSTLPRADLVLGVQIIVFSAAVRWPVAFYIGVLAGLQRIQMVNLLRSAALLLRLAGGLVVILIARSLPALLMWTAFAAAVEVIAFATCATRAFPALGIRPFWSRSALRAALGFSIAMNAISILALFTIQASNILIPKLVSVEALGFYTLAWNVVNAIALVQTAIGAAMFPSFAEDHSRERHQLVRERYDRAVGLVVSLACIPAFVAVFFGFDVLSAWVGTHAAAGAARSMSLLGVGSLLNATVATSFGLITAAGNASLPLRVNAAGVVLYLPLLAVLIDRFGVEGASAGWIVINLYYLFTLMPAVNRRLLDRGAFGGFAPSVLPSVAAALIAFGGTFVALESLDIDSLARRLLAMLLAIAVYVVVLITLVPQSPLASLQTMVWRAVRPTPSGGGT